MDKLCTLSNMRHAYCVYSSPYHLLFYKFTPWQGKIIEWKFIRNAKHMMVHSFKSLCFTVWEVVVE